MKPSNLVMLGLLIATAWVAAFMAATGGASWLEAVSLVTGAACVWLTVTESLWNFPISLLNVSTFCIVFYRAGLYADASLQIVYFVLTAIGWYMWALGGEKKTALKITRTRTREIALVIAAVAVLTIVFWRTLALLGGSASFWDAITTAISLAPQWLLNRKKIENWIFWIVADVIYIPLYIYKELYLTSGLYAAFLIMATIGLIQWIQKYRKAKAGTPDFIGFPVEVVA